MARIGRTIALAIRNTIKDGNRDNPILPSRRTKHPWVSLDVGESFEVAGDAGHVKAIRCQATKYGFNLGRTFVVNKVQGGCVVTRVD